ncbi:hypothetical protein QVD17_33984 [Tagetes erecta]|uniref:Uncharacterized protein n=1 Tax=Tagetes erecta TaxID=13708 RepID=A0AAD8K1K2_TARER|nr:hypothetical protein QVD17_33984 [Tagetes erecta]
MQKQSVSVGNLATLIVVSLIVLLTICNASHGSLGFTLLESLGHTHNPPPGNGCSETGNGGNHCKPPVNEKAFAGQSWATSTSPPSSSLFLVYGGTVTNRKMMMMRPHEPENNDENDANDPSMLALSFDRFVDFKQNDRSDTLRRRDRHNIYPIFFLTKL